MIAKGVVPAPTLNLVLLLLPHSAKAKIEISRKQVGIEWDTGVNGEITSGVYRGGTTEYPVTRAKAFTSLRKNATNGHTFVFRATEDRQGRPGILEADWIRDNPTNSWYIGRNTFSSMVTGR